MVALRIVYFVLVGWWAALIWGLVAYLCCATYVLLPAGTLMFNRLPLVLTLKPAPRDACTGRLMRELPWLIRVIWFFVVGWWLGLLAFKLGYLLCATLVGLPLGVWVLHRLPLAMTLRQSS